jgi:hypothetical protein
MIFVMRMLTTLIVTHAFLGALFGALLGTAASAQQPGRDHGAGLLMPFKQNLQQALREGLSKGPVQALSACRVEAPKIADGLSQEGIRVGRTSHRLRNPANRSPEWVRPILEAYLANPSSRTPRSLPLPEGRTGYVEPILMQSLCLTCHGQSPDSNVAAELERLYPEDEAVGFEVGELRGVFWVEFPTTDDTP